MELGGELKAWFSEQICQTDREVLSLQHTPDCKDQQALEALAILVALKGLERYMAEQAHHLGTTY